MYLSTVMVADGVRQGSDGKLYIFGGQWDRIFAAKVPSTQAIALALVIDVGNDEALKPHDFRVTYRWEDGEAFGPNIAAKMQFGHPPGLKPGAPFSFPVAVEAQPVQLDRYGRFEIVVELDDAVAGTRPLEVLPSTGW